MAYVSLRRVPDAVGMMERYLSLRPDDEQAVEVLEKLRVALEADSVGVGDR